MTLRAMTWNLFHGRDFPPDPALRTWRSRLLRISERNRTHLQVNRDLFREFASLLAAAEWDIALLQESPPRWSRRLAAACDADGHLVLTSRNSLAPLRALAARLNPDLIASNEGGSNLTLVRRATGTIVERRELELSARAPERRTLAFARIRLDGGGSLCAANLHASAGAENRAFAEREVALAAERATAWAADDPLLFGGDLNLRPRDTEIYGELERTFGLRGMTGPDSLDHLLVRGLDPVAPPRSWDPSEREVDANGLAIRLSDHSPVEATFAV
jgi:endonuclease/exonuclease/phosphatase family metal-dependent hydrolase